MQELGSLIPWSEEIPENPNVKGMVMKWQYEAGRVPAEEPNMPNKRLKDSMTWTECKVVKGSHTECPGEKVTLQGPRTVCSGEIAGKQGNKRP